MRSTLIYRMAVAAFCLAMAGLTGCATMQPNFETPSVTFTSFRMLPSSGITPEFEIGLRVTNPNAQALKLRGLAYTASLDGEELIKGVANELPIIDGYGTGDVTLTVTPDVMGGIQFFSKLMRDPRDTVRYELEAKLDVGSFVPAIRVRDEGKISLRAQ